MLRILDITEAVRLRGWPADLDATVPIEIENENGSPWDRYMLRITGGSSEINSTNAEGKVTFTRRQLAVWFAEATEPSPQPASGESAPNRAQGRFERHLVG